MAGGVRAMGGVHGRKNGNCSGRYASYWNAFLFVMKICLDLRHRSDSM